MPLYPLIQQATLFSGLTLALLLGFAKKTDQIANLFLSSALVAVILKAGGNTSFLLPALGPLLYLYVRQLTSPEYKFGRKDLHFHTIVYTFTHHSILSMPS